MPLSAPTLGESAMIVCIICGIVWKGSAINDPSNIPKVLHPQCEECLVAGAIISEGIERAHFQLDRSMAIRELGWGEGREGTYREERRERRAG